MMILCPGSDNSFLHYQASSNQAQQPRSLNPDKQPGNRYRSHLLSRGLSAAGCDCSLSDLSRVRNSPSSRSRLFPILILHDVSQLERQEIDAVRLANDLGQLPAIHAEAIRHHGHRRQRPLTCLGCWHLTRLAIAALPPTTMSIDLDLTLASQLHAIDPTPFPRFACPLLSQPHQLSVPPTDNHQL